MSVTGKIIVMWRRFLKSAKGVAAVEFALIMPLLLTLFVGSVDLSQAISADRKLASAAGALGDLVSQTQQSLTTATLNDYFIASEAIMQPFDGNGVGFVVSLIRVEDDGTASVEWSQPHNGASAYAQGAPFDLSSEIVDIARGTFVVMSEAQYEYRPIGGFVLNANIPLRKEFFFMPRFGDRIDLN